MSKPNGRFFSKFVAFSEDLNFNSGGLWFTILFLKKENIYVSETTLSKKYDTAAVYFAEDNFAPFFHAKKDRKASV